MIRRFICRSRKKTDNVSSQTGFIYNLTNDDSQRHAGDGDDHLIGHKSDNHLHGGGGHDYIHGKEGDDTIHGGVGSDSLYGGVGDDHLDGSVGDDHLTGNKGLDSFVLSSGHDVIHDFNAKHGDRLLVDLQSFPYIKLIEQGEDLVISTLEGDSTTTLLNTEITNSLYDSIDFVDSL